MEITIVNVHQLIDHAIDFDLNIYCVLKERLTEPSSFLIF